MINKVILVGRLGKDPEQKHTQSGTSICNFSVATSERWTKDGEKQERTEWHRIVAFGKLADICAQYLGKGQLVYIEGRIQTRSWEQDGVTRYATEIVASNMQMLERRDDDRDKAPDTGPDDDTIPF